MPNKKKTPLTPQQYRTAQERTAWFKEAVEENGLQVFQVAAAAGKHPQTLYRWMAIGLTSEQYSVLMTAVSLLASKKGGEPSE